ncbi:unnamed protein product [Sphagnum troendelagicum]|uniref:Uncharacterized protein n=1 Tax=Sphagnum troendelagicum TaxID=128251 RepID=A0ABP0TS56_9BRYO
MERMQEETATVDATETRQRKESGEEQKSTSTTTMSKRSTKWGLRRWKRFSPLQLLRFIRDTYVTGCVSAGNNVHLKGMAQHTAIFNIPDDAFSRQSSQRDDGEAKLLQALSRQSSRKDESQGLQAQQKTITPIVFSADQPARFSHSVSAKRTSFESSPMRPELEQFESREFSSAAALPDLLRTSTAVHRTATLLRAQSKPRVASLESYNNAGGNPVNLDLKKDRIARSNSLAARFSTSDIPDGIPANPFRNFDAFGRAPGRMSVDLLSGRISPALELVRSTSIVEDGELSYVRRTSSSSQSSLKHKIIGFEEFKRSKSKKANQPNPYSFYDSRFPPAATVNQ